MRLTANVHTDDETPVSHRVLRDARGRSVPVLYIGSDVTIFVTRESVAQIIKAAKFLAHEMDEAELAAEAAEARLSA